MKRYLFISLLVTCLSIQLFSQEEIKWYSLEEAIELNKYVPRKFVVDVYTDWCGWCKRMDQSTFADSAVAAFVNKHFYAVKFDAEMKEPLMLGGRVYKFIDSGRRGYHEMAAVLTKGQLSYPTIVYLDEKTSHIKVDPGFKNKEQFLQTLIWVKEEKYKPQIVPFRY